MIDKRGPGLEQLSLEGVGPKVLDPIVKHCKNIRLLTLRSCYIGNTKAIIDALPNVQISVSSEIVEII